MLPLATVILFAIINGQNAGASGTPAGMDAATRSAGTTPISRLTDSCSAISHRVTIDTIVAMALRHNLSIKDSRILSERAHNDLSAAKAAFLPRMTADGSCVNSSYPSRSAVVSNDLDVTVNGEMTLFDGFASINRFRKSKTALAATEHSLVATTQEIIFKSVAGYLAACRDSEYVAIEHRSVEEQQQLLAKITAFKDLGQRPVSDFLSQKVYAAQSAISCNGVENNYLASKYSLLELIGTATLSGDFHLVVPPADTAILVSLLSCDSLIATALSNRFDIREQRLEVRIADIDLSLAKSAFLPTLVFGGNIASRYADLTTARNIKQLTHDNLQTSVYLTLNIPLFDQMSALHSVSRAVLQVRQKREHLDNLIKGVAIQLHESCRLLGKLQQQYRMSVTALDDACAALAMIQKRYDSGLLTLAELYAAYSLVNQTRRQKNTARYAIMHQIAAIGYYSGDITPAMKRILQ